MIHDAPPAAKKPFYRELFFQVIVAIVLGVLLGHFAPRAGVAMKPLGDAFIRLIKMMIPLVIFCTVTSGIAGMGSLKNAGRVGIKALIYFETMTTLALVIGLLVMHLWQPGASMHVDPATLDAEAIEPYVAKAAEQKTVADSFLHIIPDTINDAFAKGDMLQVLLVSLLFAMALLSLGNRAYNLVTIIQQFSDVLYRIIGFIVRLAPLGAFGAMAFTVGKYGVEALGPLLSLMIGFYVTCILFVGLALGAVMRLCGLRLWPFLKYIKEEILIVLGTSSSEAALPRLIEKMTALGCVRPVVGMVIPAGYSFNLDGTSIYLTMATLFIAQALGISLTTGQELAMLGVLLLTSKGAAAVSGGGFIVLAGSLSSVGHIPVEGLALILGVDRFMSEARAITNLIGNGVGTIVVSRWERAIDMEKAKEVLGLRLKA